MPTLADKIESLASQHAEVCAAARVATRGKWPADLAGRRDDILRQCAAVLLFNKDAILAGLAKPVPETPQ